MARHRNIRSMNISDEYDGYDDVYGHSVEDDFCVSPSEEAFMFRRENNRNQQIGAFIKDEQENKLPENETEKLEDCIAKLKTVLGNATSESEMTDALLDNNLDVDKALNYLIDSKPSKQMEKKEKDDNLLRLTPPKRFNIPKLNTFNIKIKNNILATSNDTLKLNNSPSTTKSFSSLKDLSANHLKNVNSPFSIPKLKPNMNGLLKRNDIKSDVEKTNSNGNQSDNNNIDLTKALITKSSQKSISGLSKKFEYLDVSCDVQPRDDINCLMDITFILNTTSDLSKGVSAFGRILCHRYKKFVPKIQNHKQSQYMFSFDILSPDDMILSYLKT